MDNKLAPKANKAMKYRGKRVVMTSRIIEGYFGHLTNVGLILEKCIYILKLHFWVTLMGVWYILCTYNYGCAYRCVWNI